MSAEAFVGELREEAKSARRILERVPDEHLPWRPHPKSMSLGQLAHHIAVLPRGIVELIAANRTEVPNVPLDQAESSAALVATLDKSIEHAVERLNHWGDAGLAEQWQMSVHGNVIFDMPRHAMFRYVMLNHWYHHRGQLTVYLRLLEVPLPSVYGPTADEQMF